MNYILLISVVLLAITVFVLAILTNKKQSDIKIQAKSILTPNELEFFYRLGKALPDYHIFPQVSLGAILMTSGNKGRYVSRNSFSQKIADYIICEKSSMKILAIVELDDKTHNREKDIIRDKMLSDAGYRTIRFQSKNKPSESEIGAYFISEPKNIF